MAGETDDGAPTGLLRYSVGYFLVSLIFILITAPYVLETRNGGYAEIIMMTISCLMAILAVGGRHRSLAVAILLAVPAMLGRWLHHFYPGLMPVEITLIFGTLFLTFIIIRFLRFILFAPKVNSEVLCAAISVYLLMGFVWALAYGLIWRINPEAFAFTLPSSASDSRVMEGFTAVYFSFTTLSTIGYGDIVPAAPAARMMAVTEAITGMFYVAVLIARLVSLYSSPPARKH